MLIYNLTCARCSSKWLICMNLFMTLWVRSSYYPLLHSWGDWGTERGSTFSKMSHVRIYKEAEVCRAMTLTMTLASSLPKPWHLCSFPRLSLSQWCLVDTQWYLKIKETQVVVKQSLQSNFSPIFVHLRGTGQDRTVSYKMRMITAFSFF